MTRRTSSGAIALCSFVFAVGCGAHRQVVVTEPASVATTSVQAPGLAVAPVTTVTSPTVISTRGDGEIPGRDWHDPGVYASRIRRDADEIEADVVRDVRHGDLTQTALGDVRARRAYIEQMISQYSSDGFIHRDERRHVDTLLDNLRDAKHRYPQAFGGGPR